MDLPAPRTLTVAASVDEPPPIELEPEPDLARVGSTLFQEMLSRFVEPEVSRRQEAGEWPVDAGIYRFQVLFHQEREPEVRFNEQVGGMLEAVAARALEKGEDVMLEDIAGVKGYKPRSEDDGVPHVTAFAHRDGWSLAFEFNYRHPRRFEYLASGREFAASACEALSAGRVGVALDNAFSACELLAKAELLSCHPTVDDALASNSHGAVARPYSLWARLDNTDARFVRLLYRLQELRPAGRYLNKELTVDADQASELIALLSEMEQHVTRVANGEDAGESPRGFNVIAARDIKAGQLVWRGDYTLRRAKPERRTKPSEDGGD